MSHILKNLPKVINQPSSNEPTMRVSFICERTTGPEAKVRVGVRLSTLFFDVEGAYEFPTGSEPNQNK